MEVSGHPHTQATLASGKAPQYIADTGLGGPWTRSEHYTEKYLCPNQESNAKFMVVQPTPWLLN
jgi:hypothetical protein